MINVQRARARRGKLRVGLGVVAAIALVAGLVAAMVPRQSRAVQPAPLQGTSLVPRLAPNFHLRDQLGRTVSLHRLRGRVVVLTFFYTHCPDTCPLTSEKLRRVVDALGPDGRHVVVLEVTTDPRHDTPALARRFLHQHGLPQCWHFLLGSLHDVAPVWSAYHVYAGSPVRGAPTHSAFMYLIDSRGRERVLLDDSAPPQEINADVEILLGHDARVTSATSVPEIGAAAPEFTLSTLHGRSLALHSLRGKVVLVNFWATWCVPCAAELPRLEAVYRRDRSQGLVVVGVDQEEIPSAVRQFVLARHVTYPVVLDTDGSVGFTYHILGTPSSFVVDRSGTIRSVTVGPVSLSALRRTLRPLLRST